MMEWGRPSHRRRQTTEALRRAKVTAPELAVTLESLGIPRDRALRQLIEWRVVRQVDNGRVYLDEKALTELDRRVWMVAVTPLQLFLGSAVLLAILLLIQAALKRMP